MDAFHLIFNQGKKLFSFSLIHLPHLLSQKADDHRGSRGKEITPWVLRDRHLAESIIRKKNTLKQLRKNFLSLKFMENSIFWGQDLI